MPRPATHTGRAAGRTATPAQATVVLRRLPGKARPREDVLREYRALNAERRSRIPALLWPFWAPDPDKFYRWRVQLDCFCITEVLTGGQTVGQTIRNGLILCSAWLPAGQLLCAHDDSPPAPYREIVGWGDHREVTFPADPAAPPAWADAEIWALLRHDEPHTSAFWTVTLSCGHSTEVPVSGLGWRPADGPSRVSAGRLLEMTTEFEELWAQQPDVEPQRERAHTQRMLAEGWPNPSPEHHCYTCLWARAIVACQRIGWLVPRTRVPELPKPPSRASLEQRLRQAEAQTEELRRQLAQLDSLAKQRDG